jgi:hypothetical protein
LQIRNPGELTFGLEHRVTDSEAPALAEVMRLRAAKERCSGASVKILCGGAVMKSLLTMVVLGVTLAGACYGQGAGVSVTGKGKQKWSQSEVNRVYLSACSAVQREFYNRTAPRPTVALILGADKNIIDYDKKTILLRKWDRYLFAQGVVLLAFEDLLTPERRLGMVTRAVNLADASVDVRELRK